MKDVKLFKRVGVLEFERTFSNNDSIEIAGSDDNVLKLVGKGTEARHNV